MKRARRRGAASGNRPLRANVVSSRQFSRGAGREDLLVPCHGAERRRSSSLACIARAQCVERDLGETGGLNRQLPQLRAPLAPSPSPSFLFFPFSLPRFFFLLPFLLPPCFFFSASFLFPLASSCFCINVAVLPGLRRVAHQNRGLRVVLNLPTCGARTRVARAVVQSNQHFRLVRSRNRNRKNSNQKF